MDETSRSPAAIAACRALLCCCVADSAPRLPLSVAKPGMPGDTPSAAPLPPPPPPTYAEAAETGDGAAVAAAAAAVAATAAASAARNRSRSASFSAAAAAASAARSRSRSFSFSDSAARARSASAPLLPPFPPPRVGGVGSVRVAGATGGMVAPADFDAGAAVPGGRFGRVIPVTAAPGRIAGRRPLGRSDSSTTVGLGVAPASFVEGVDEGATGAPPVALTGRGPGGRVMPTALAPGRIAGRMPEVEGSVDGGEVEVS